PACWESLPAPGARQSRAVRQTARCTRSHVVCDLGAALLDAEPGPVPGACEDLVGELLVALRHLDPDLVDHRLAVCVDLVMLGRDDRDLSDLVAAPLRETGD